VDKDFPDLRADHNRPVESGDSRAERYALTNVEARQDHQQLEYRARTGLRLGAQRGASTAKHPGALN
jgi:hypothetical protein